MSASCDQSAPVLFTPIKGIYSQCLSIKLMEISLANLSHGLKKPHKKVLNAL